MSILDQEPVVEAATAPVRAVAPTTSSTDCTRDTRGEAPCSVKNCENCN